MTDDARARDTMRQERIAENDATFREANERIARAATQVALNDEPMPFLCECADRSCFEIVRVVLADYQRVRANARWFLSADGHETDASDATIVVERHAGYQVVEKQGRAGEVAELLADEQDVAR